jgi:hypothetical protein
MFKSGFVLVVLSFLLISCTISATPTQDVNEIVQATFQAMTAQATEPTTVDGTPEPTEPTSAGSLSGQLSYPSEAIPALRVVAFDVNSQDYFYIETSYNQISYQITGLPAGTYFVVAYTLGGGSFPAGLSGGYTEATLCGLSANCTDHSLSPVNVTPGQDTPNVDPTDWYAGENAFPPMPGPASSEGTGSITGSLSYPSEFIPPLRVFAYQVGSESYFYVDTLKDQPTYQIDNLPAGYYQVVAYILNGGLPAGYSQAVPCGLSVDCTNHDLIQVPVNSGQVVTGVDPGDWYAPEGTFPPPPVMP